MHNFIELTTHTNTKILINLSQVAAISGTTELDHATKAYVEDGSIIYYGDGSDNNASFVIESYDEIKAIIERQKKEGDE